MLTFIRRPVIFGALWQCFGAAISLPIYFAKHLQWLSSAGVTQPRVRSSGEAKAVPFSFLLGAVLPTVVGMAPTWLGYGHRAAESHQSILAAWQPDPLWVALLQLAGAAAFSRMMTKTQSDATSRSKQDEEAHKWTLVSYLLALVSSTSGHLYVMYRVATSQNAATNLWRMYVPANLVRVENFQHILLEGPWLFLKYDFLIISLSSLSWTYYLLQHTSREEGKPGASSKLVLLLAMLFGSALLGPGAVVSLALFWRERSLVAKKAEKVV